MPTVSTLREGPTEFVFSVTVTEGGGSTRHEVTASKADVARLSRAGEAKERFIERVFQFLLEREPKESILRSFDIRVISTYFSEFEREIRK